MPETYEHLEYRCNRYGNEVERLKKALRDISNAEDGLKAKGIGYNVTVDTIAKIALGVDDDQN